jgi:phage terminase large subunit-like protein
MPFSSTTELFPLPVAHTERTRPEDFLPEVDDETGQAAVIWEILLNLKLGLAKFSGTPFRDQAQEWQRRLIWAVFGPTDHSGNRLVDEVFLTIAKKNGKTSFLALLPIAYHLMTETPDARMVMLASTKDQASLLYTPLKSAIEQDPELLRLANVREYRGDVLFYNTQAQIKCISPELHSTVGEAPEFFIVDELHLLGKKKVGASMIRQLTSGLSVSGGMGWYITTAPIAGEPAAGAYIANYNRAKKILEGRSTIEERMLPVMFEMPEDSDPHERKFWWMPNPNLDVTFSRNWLEQQYGVAREDPDPEVLNEFFSQHLNKIASASAGGIDSWILSRRWDEWSDPSITLERICEDCVDVYAGVDAGGQDDMTGLLLLGRTQGGMWLVWSHAWLTVDGYEHHPGNKTLYDQFIEAGELTVVGLSADEEMGEDLEAALAILRRVKNLTQIGVDPYGLAEFAAEAESIAPVVGIAQGFRLGPHIEGIEREAFAGRVQHHGSACLAWCIRNAVVEATSSAKTLKKPGGQYSDRKVDLAICLVLAYGASQDDYVAPSVYDDVELGYM